MRKLYSFANQLQQDSCLVATTSTFYLTLDDLLHKHKIATDRMTAVGQASTGQANELVKYLEPNFLNLVWDLFMHEDGARLRDRLSHGELKFEVPSLFYQQLCVVSCRFLLLGHRIAKSRTRFPALGELFAKLNAEYESNYHPIDRLISSLFELERLNLQLQQALPLESPQQTQLQEIRDEFTADLARRFSTTPNDLDPYIASSLRSRWKSRLSTDLVYRTEERERSHNAEEQKLVRKLTALIALNIKLVPCLIEFGAQVKEAHSLEAQTSRRQWENMKRFEQDAKHLFVHLLALNLYYYIHLLEALVLSSPACDLDLMVKVNAKILTKQQKRLENLVTKSRENQWLECQQLLEGAGRSPREIYLVLP